MRNILMAAALCAALAPIGVVVAKSAGLPESIAAAVADPTRPASDTSSDVNRKPAETLAFAGVKPGMIVGEFYPGGGYFTRMLSDVVGPKGHVYGIEKFEWDDGSDKKATAALKNVTIQLDKFGEFSLPEKADLFWVTQNYHD